MSTSETTEASNGTGNTVPYHQPENVDATTATRFWAHSAPWDDENTDAATHFTAMAHAYLSAWISSALRPSQERSPASAPTRGESAAAIALYFKPFVAAYTAAALLHGQSIDQIRAHLLAGDVALEQLGDWLTAAGFTEDQISALSVLPPAQQSVEPRPDHSVPTASGSPTSTQTGDGGLSAAGGAR
jgi:hypothetical protein